MKKCMHQNVSNINELKLWKKQINGMTAHKHKLAEVILPNILIHSRIYSRDLVQFLSKFPSHFPQK